MHASLLVLRSIDINNVTDISRIITLITTSHKVTTWHAFVLLRPTFAVPSKSIACQVRILGVEALSGLLFPLRVGLDSHILVFVSRLRGQVPKHTFTRTAT